MVLVAPLKKSRSTSACKGGEDWSAWPETAKVSIDVSRGAAAVMHDRFVDGDRGNASDEDAEKEMLYLREKIVEAVREGDAQETKHLLGLSLGRRLMPAHEKSSGWGLLHFSCSRGFLDVTRSLLSAGANPLTTLDKRGKTCLHLAIEHDSREVTELLLNRHPVGDWPRLSKLTLGQTAARTGRTAVMRLLLQGGLDPNERGRNNETPLHYAARHGHHRVIDVLLQHGADVGARERWAGRTPLHYACQGGSLKAATALIVNGGADAHLRDFSGSQHTPLEAAAVCGHLSVSHRLLLLVECRRRADAKREVTADMAATAKREIILSEAKAAKRRVAIAKGVFSRKRSLLRMEKRELMDNLRAQTTRANSRLRNLYTQHERLEKRINSSEFDRYRPGTCPASFRADN